MASSLHPAATQHSTQGASRPCLTSTGHTNTFGRPQQHQSTLHAPVPLFGLDEVPTSWQSTTLTPPWNKGPTACTGRVCRIMASQQPSLSPCVAGNRLCWQSQTLLENIKQAATSGDLLPHLIQDAEADSTRWVDVLQGAQPQHAQHGVVISQCCCCTQPCITSVRCYGMCTSWVWALTGSKGEQASKQARSSRPSN